MNTVKAKCGHEVPAVGEEGSIERMKCVGMRCPECRGPGLTNFDEVVIKALYREGCRRKAYCTSTVPLTFRKWNQVHPVDENTTVYEVPAGTTLKIVMVSRFDDCGLTEDLNAMLGYDCRVSWESGDIENIRWEP